jgi:hypothetical protein
MVVETNGTATVRTPTLYVTRPVLYRLLALGLLGLALGLRRAVDASAGSDEWDAVGQRRDEQAGAYGKVEQPAGDLRAVHRRDGDED